MKFKVGDIVTGTNSYYSITNTRLIKAEVTKVNENIIDIKVLEHKDDWCVGNVYRDLDEKHFKLVKKAYEIIEKGTEKSTFMLGSVEILNEKEAKYIIIDGITISIPIDTPIGISSKIDEDDYHEETGKALAYLRLIKGGN